MECNKCGCEQVSGKLTNWIREGKLSLNSVVEGVDKRKVAS